MMAPQRIDAAGLARRLAAARPGAPLNAAGAQAPELALLDVSEEGQYGLGHLLWAASTPYSRLEQVVPPLVPRRDCPVVLMDHGDGVALLAARRLAALGYTDLALLDGGVPAWAAAGGELFHGVYVPGKVFGEWLEHARGTPSITPAQLLALKEEGADLCILDPRTPAEHAVRHVPGALSCPGGELLRRLRDVVPSPQTLVVVACGGRTRGLVGAQTLIEAGVPNPVVALADGNHGWQLAGHALAQGAVAAKVGTQGAIAAAFAREHAGRLARRAGTPEVVPAQLAAWLKAEDRTTYLLDVRSAEEYAAGHLAGARWAVGGQLLQAADRWMASLGARVVLVDDDGVRAHQVAYWLRAMGWQAAVLAGGLAAATAAGLALAHGGAGTVVAADADAAARIQGESVAAAGSGLPALSPQQAALRLEAGARVWCFDASADFLRAHPPGARWASRARLEAVFQDLAAGTEILLCSADGGLAHLAGIDLVERDGAARIAVIQGGLQAWEAAGLPLSHPEAADADRLLPAWQRVDVLYWAQDRRRGNREAMRAYLDWERQLTTQLARDGSAFFLPALAADTQPHTGEPLA